MYASGGRVAKAMKPMAATSAHPAAWRERLQEHYISSGLVLADG